MEPAYLETSEAAEASVEWQELVNKEMNVDVVRSWINAWLQGTADE
jgi:hypothetical protein